VGWVMAYGPRTLVVDGRKESRARGHERECGTTDGVAIGMARLDLEPSLLLEFCH